ncbi:YhfZ family protein [Sodalis sp. RH16]|jgi:ribosomal protein S25|uniref:YhfZ family protein n=1 Tax=Sodalis sp. RH16 TaxID=3394331 RepID=UPI0039B41782
MNKEVIDQQAIVNAKKVIAVHALSSGCGKKLITNAQLFDEYGIVAGTVQRALRNLIDSGALVTVSKGHLGRIIEYIDVGLCWNLAKLNPVHLLMPHSGSVEVDTLVSIITQQLGRLNIPYFINYAAGGAFRLNSVLSGKSDIVLTSLGVINSHYNPVDNNTIKILNTGSYYAINRLIVVTRTLNDLFPPQRIGIDSSSLDHLKLTQLEFPEKDGFSYVETEYRHIPVKILKGEIDAGLWHMTSSPIPLSEAGLRGQLLSRKESLEAHDALSAGVFIVNPHRIELSAILAKLDNKMIHELQQKCIQKEDPLNMPFEI